MNFWRPPINKPILFSGTSTDDNSSQLLKKRGTGRGRGRPRGSGRGRGNGRGRAGILLSAAAAELAGAQAGKSAFATYGYSMSGIKSSKCIWYEKHYHN